MQLYPDINSLFLFLKLLSEYIFQCVFCCFSRLRNRLGLAENTVLFIVVINTVLSVIAGVLVHYVYKNELEQNDDPVENRMYAIKGGLMIWIAFFSQFMSLLGKVRALSIWKTMEFATRDEIPDFLFLTTMAKIRNTGISSLYLA